jgi:hypothetical protein
VQKLGVKNVIPVEPDPAADGLVISPGADRVATRGVTLAAAAGIAGGHAGVLCRADHVVRCLVTARANGIEADSPNRVVLRTRYDAKSARRGRAPGETPFPSICSEGPSGADHAIR